MAAGRKDVSLSSAGVMRGAGLTASVSVSGLRRPVSVTRRQAPDRHGSVRGPGSRELQKVFVEITQCIRA